MAEEVPHPLKAGSRPQGVGRRRVLEYSSLPRTQRTRFCIHLPDGDLGDVGVLEPLRHIHGQHAVLEHGGQAGGVGILEVDATGGMERGGLTQDIVALLNVLGVLVVDVDDKATGIELNVDLLAGDTGDMGLNDVAVGVLLNVHLEGVGSLGTRLVLLLTVLFHP